MIEPSQSKLSIGTKVKIRTDLRPSFYYDGMFMIPEMLRYGGRKATIVRTSRNYDNIYALDVDDGAWHWSAEMFEPVETLSPDDFYSAIMGGTE
jgi:hypothetical protein